jgi:hypothetical protein
VTSEASLSKVLSANDVGETGTHQAGILVPKNPAILAFFPKLQRDVHNPRVHLWFYESDGLTRWEFAFIYYNNARIGGTRDEYRLTRMTAYLRAANAKAGDTLRLSRDESGRHGVTVERTTVESDDGVLRLSGGWKIIQMKGR